MDEVAAADVERGVPDIVHAAAEEQDVAGLQVVEINVHAVVVHILRHAVERVAVLTVGVVYETGAVKADFGRGAAPDVGHAEILHRGIHDRLRRGGVMREARRGGRFLCRRFRGGSLGRGLRLRLRGRIERRHIGNGVFGGVRGLRLGVDGDVLAGHGRGGDGVGLGGAVEHDVIAVDVTGAAVIHAFVPGTAYAVHADGRAGLQRFNHAAVGARAAAEADAGAENGGVAVAGRGRRNVGLRRNFLRGLLHGVLRRSLFRSGINVLRGRDLVKEQIVGGHVAGLAVVAHLVPSIAGVAENVNDSALRGSVDNVAVKAAAVAQIDFARCCDEGFAGNGKRAACEQRRRQKKRNDNGKQFLTVFHDPHTSFSGAGALSWNFSPSSALVQAKRSPRPWRRTGCLFRIS